jgi:hypothetical protein
VAPPQAVVVAYRSPLSVQVALPLVSGSEFSDGAVGDAEN